MSGDGIGASVLRKEDRRLLTGRGRYSGDISVAGEFSAVFRRSDIAHGRIATSFHEQANTLAPVVKAEIDGFLGRIASGEIKPVK